MKNLLRVFITSLKDFAVMVEKTMENSIAGLKEGESGTIVELVGGIAFQRKLRTMGIREGQTIKLVSRQPFGGPLVVEIERRQTTIGRGMARHIIVRR
jgi:ferrous iron transport protein A